MWGKGISTLLKSSTLRSVHNLGSKLSVEQKVNMLEKIMN